MTRENKVALVVGFGLILLVGILISDHLSDARTQEPANLVPPSALTATPTPHLGPELIDLQIHGDVLGPPRRSELSQGPPAVTTTQFPRPTANTPQQRESRIDPPIIRMPTLGEGSPPAIEPTSNQAGEVSITFHTVRPGESLSSICQRYYGDVLTVTALARYNDISDPNKIRAGRKLRIPKADALARNDRSNPAASSGSADRSRTYTIKRGDSLSVVAQRLLHSAGRWRQLYELNRNVISDPDTLHVGTVIKVPPSP
ncbi:MAG: LysM peptidoglycan-binding domain-containing protein [Planctomycetes bacterium]|nr:LysM peptidoglycan-binding domain-containing protein [Planctomycetota bacterium]